MKYYVIPNLNEIDKYLEAHAVDGLDGAEDETGIDDDPGGCAGAGVHEWFLYRTTNKVGFV